MARRVSVIGCQPSLSAPTQGGLQTTYLDFIRNAKRTEIAGEAEDFCVRAGMQQVLDYYGSEPTVLESISFIVLVLILLDLVLQLLL